MNVIEIQDITPNTKLVSFKDTAMLLNIMYPETVEDLLEVFTDFTDFDIIAELVDTLDLNITAVIEPANHGVLVHGYIHNEGVVA